MRFHINPVPGIVLAAVACLASACAPTTGGEGRSIAADSLQGITWEWTGTATPERLIEVPEPDRYTIRFKDDGEARIRYDCNHGGALYEVAEGRLSFGPLTFTRIKCGEGSYSITYRQQLEVVTSFFTEKGHLYLQLPEESGTMRFRRTGTD